MPDPAVAIVQSYLRVNGYFTVTEHPIVEAAKGGGHRTVTDLDVLAFRFPGAGRSLVTGRPESDPAAHRYAPDPGLGIEGAEADMLIGEVKQGRAVLNRGAAEPGCSARRSPVSAAVRPRRRPGSPTSSCGEATRRSPQVIAPAWSPSARPPAILAASTPRRTPP
jgi:hypothetical protein